MASHSNFHPRLNYVLRGWCLHKSSTRAAILNRSGFQSRNSPRRSEMPASPGLISNECRGFWMALSPAHFCRPSRYTGTPIRHGYLFETAFIGTTCRSLQVSLMFLAGSTPTLTSAPPNTSLQLTRRFLRFGGHPELTIQE